jgi:hypothetical protein
MHNSDKFDHLIALAAMKCVEKEARELNEIDTSDVEFSASYYKKRAKIIRQCKRHSAASFSKAFVVKLVAVVAVVAMMTGVIIGCMPELRRAIYNAIVEWYDNYFAVRYESADGEKETGFDEETESSPSATAAPTYIVSVRKPTILPEGVREEVVLETLTKFSADYYVDDQCMFSFSQYVLKSNDKYLDGENVDVSYIEINGHTATVVICIDEKGINILWSDKEYSYHIFSTKCDAETLLQYAESVK